MTGIPPELPDALERLGELIRATAAPAGPDEICHEGLTRAARAVGAQGGTLVVRHPTAGTLPAAAARHGDASEPEMDRLARRAIATGEANLEEAPPAFRLAQPLSGAAGTLGALVLERSSAWDPAALAFVRSAACALAGGLHAAWALAASRLQGELLVRRNVELEIVRELVSRLHEVDGEEEMLRDALELVLSKMGLHAGWVFCGDLRQGRLELAASRGLSEEFVRRSRDGDIGTCLCQDVFASGKLQVARNTTDCPRLPELVPGGGPTGHACIPLRFERGVLGVMNIAHRPGQPFTPEELQFLETIGHQVCLAVDKVRTARAEGQRHAEAQEALVRLQQAQDGMVRAERLAAVGTLAASLAHEVRNPLNSINLQLVLLARRVKRLDGVAQPELTTLIDTAQREIARLDALVEEFLSLSSIDRLELAEADAAGVVREVLALMTPVARESGVAVEGDLGPVSPPVRMDREKIKQALINLVRNALEAMPEGGVLRLSIASAGDSVVIRVADTGVGIEPGLDVFDFFTTTKRGGTGLGLPITRRIVEAHGGSLVYDSRLGLGTQFSIALPAAGGGKRGLGQIP